MKRFLKKILHIVFHDKAYIILNKRRYYTQRRIILSESKDYNKNKFDLMRKKANKDSISILFFVYNLAMWKYEGLMKLLVANPRFNPIIVPFVMPEKLDAVNKDNQDEIIAYCRSNGFPYKLGYDFQSKQYLDISDIYPDIVVYTQPYNVGYNAWKAFNYKSDCLFIYTPYGISVTDDRALYDTYINNIAWKIFAGSSIERELLTGYISSPQANIVVTGASIYDQLNNANKQMSPWRSANKKHIIWAPHHSINSKYSFSTSNFERICMEMVNIAKKYKNEVEFAFKPHPVLKERLIEQWGDEKTESYYKLWETMPNTISCTGNYTELFAFSDAMIHDCSSFICEYLYVNKPAMYICKGNRLPSGVNNRLGLECFNCHYHGHNIEDIERFINEVVIGGIDPYRDKRNVFYNRQLMPPGGKTVAENMLIELEDIFSYK